MTRIALAQINPTVGDLDGNAAKILAAYRQSPTAELVVFPELALTGYPPEDLILMPSFRQAAIQKLHELAAQTAQGPAMIIGSVWEDLNNSLPPGGGGLGRGGSFNILNAEFVESSPSPRPSPTRGEGEVRIFNTAFLLDAGKILHIQPKTMLPNYDVFDEKRLFSPGAGPQAIQWRGHTIGIMVCEDMWYPALAAEFKKQNAELLIVINASPFEAGKLAQRHEVAAEAVRQSGTPLIYVNTIGGQDDLVFDGGSFAMSGQGEVVMQMPEFEEALETTVIPSVAEGSYGAKERSLGYARDDKESLWSAMMLGLHDYIHKNGFSGVVLGLSGGIDSAVSAAVAVDALGAKNVKGILLPSPYTSPESTEDALHSAQLLGIETMTIPITPGMEMMQQTLNPLMTHNPQPTIPWIEDPAVGGNIQARLRGMILMALSNRFGWMLLSTGNKSELSVGYSTLYGDSCGGYNVLKDAYKMQVYALAQWRNVQSVAIPPRSITKPPSAELAPGQKDEDQLPPYDILDTILFHHIELRQSAEEIIAQGFAPNIVQKILKMVRQSEYKRRQSCPGVKLSSMLFGKDRRYPLTNKF